MIKPKITKKAEIEARKEAQEQRRQRQAQRYAEFKELNAKPVLSNPEIQEAVKLLLAERAERMSE